MLPVLHFTREPETPEEEAIYKKWNALWVALFEAVANVPRGRRDTSPASRAAAVALVHYIHECGIPDTRKGMTKLVQDYATEQGLYLSGELNDATTREFVDAVMDSFQIDMPSRR
jgi:hypothetical protein